ncbi:esterase-like activity of phytase family protein [Allokutzneria sp. A3M-2-11 16]|uniref:esterase-like activity of phytase family protein n=1 Tax=Allokutzneria sp. A3M-2-11 16 TaxID=2962043 RepID=UPI0020B72544|nr:esterase-like activity of phytase family protein [Allokutzneria sp. A3M-2-11 16]MCP3799481.1 esterase-like activity of phytase family protein [Allokutzneria sp. A3M-2-11 16]
MLRRLLPVAVTALLVASAAPATARPAGVRLLGEHIVPFAQDYQGTTVGGLSGIDYDPKTGSYVLICDDRSDRQPARFYTAKIDITKDGLRGFELTGTKPFLRPDGSTYPAYGKDPAGATDPEDIRIDPWTGNYLWTSEGDRITGEKPVLVDPTVLAAHKDGRFARALPLAPNLKMSAQEVGPRRNAVLEGLTFAAGGALVVSSMEGPLFQDGPEATLTDGALSRITVQDRFAGRVLSQYAYPLDKVHAAPNPAGGFFVNGVDAILAVNQYDPTKFLVMERSFSTGAAPANSIRIYEVDTSGATDVKQVGSLKGDKQVKPVRKKLLVDLASLKLSAVDNVEGMSWGPRLPTGERTLVLVSDDNFAKNQVTQVIALAVR